MKIILIIAIIILSGIYAYAEEGLCSWYTRESCIREGCSGIMANGKIMENDKLTCASWKYKFGTVLKVTNIENDKYVLVTVTDRGPSKKLKDRVIDLSRGAFKKICSLQNGLCKVKVEALTA